MAVESRECCLSRAMGSSCKGGMTVLGNPGDSKPGHCPCHEVGRGCFLGLTGVVLSGLSIVSLSLGTLSQGSSLITSLYEHTGLSLLSVKDFLYGPRTCDLLASVSLVLGL